MGGRAIEDILRVLELPAIKRSVDLEDYFIRAVEGGDPEGLYKDLDIVAEQVRKKTEGKSVYWTDVVEYHGGKVVVLRSRYSATVFAVAKGDEYSLEVYGESLGQTVTEDTGVGLIGIMVMDPTSGTGKVVEFDRYGSSEAKTSRRLGEVLLNGETV